jgi:hypothetical protein
MRLSYGFVRGEVLNCLYHGWQYGTEASCLRIPAHPDLNVPPTIKANAYPVAESGGFILTSLDADAGLPPVLLAGRPIASLAIGASVEMITGLINGTPLDNLAGINATLDGVSVTLAWHVVSADKLMLHAVAIDPGDVEARVLRRLHKLRADAEGKVAA